jgi:hypothetical protein
MGAQQTTGEWPHPEAVGRRWELEGILDAWDAETDLGERRGPFDTRLVGTWVSDRHGKPLRLPLTGADVPSLADKSGAGAVGDEPNLHLEGANLKQAHLERAYLHLAYLQGADLGRAHLERASPLPDTLKNVYVTYCAPTVDLEQALMSPGTIEDWVAVPGGFDLQEALTIYVGDA